MRGANHRQSSTFRWGVLAVVVLALAVLIVGWAKRDFTIDRTVDSSFTNSPTDPVVVETAEVHVRCSSLLARRAEAHYVSATGETLFFNEATPTYPDPMTLCQSARGDRWRSVLAMGLALLLVGGTGALAGRMGRRRRDDLSKNATDSRVSGRSERAVI